MTQKKATAILDALQDKNGLCGACLHVFPDDSEDFCAQGCGCQCWDHPVLDTPLEKAIVRALN